MKKLLVLISLVMLSLTVFSQTDTSKTEKCFTIPTVKLIMKDLISGDSAKAQLKVTELQLTETEKKVVIKDSIISLLRKKEENYLMMIDGEREKFQIQKKYSDRLEKDLKIEKVKNKFKSIVGTGIIAVLTFLLIKN